MLSDEGPALGAAPPIVQLRSPATRVLAIAVESIASYPVMAALGLPLWPVAAVAMLAYVGMALGDGVAVRRIAGGVSWELHSAFGG